MVDTEEFKHYCFEPSIEMRSKIVKHLQRIEPLGYVDEFLATVVRP